MSDAKYRRFSSLLKVGCATENSSPLNGNSTTLPQKVSPLLVALYSLSRIVLLLSLPCFPSIKLFLVKYNVLPSFVIAVEDSLYCVFTSPFNLVTLERFPFLSISA